MTMTTEVIGWFAASVLPIVLLLSMSSRRKKIQLLIGRNVCLAIIPLTAADILTRTETGNAIPVIMRSIFTVIPHPGAKTGPGIGTSVPAEIEKILPLIPTMTVIINVTPADM
ncbi:MAG: hypothetical protein HFG01_10970 [Oscillibacter sp.]|nr:hypothetical protein [Oscillibacter sp.]